MYLSAIVESSSLPISSRQFPPPLEQGPIGPHAWLWKLVPGAGVGVYVCAVMMFACIKLSWEPEWVQDRCEGSISTSEPTQRIKSHGSSDQVPTCCPALVRAEAPWEGFQREPLNDKESTCHHSIWAYAAEFASQGGTKGTIFYTQWLICNLQTTRNLRKTCFRRPKCVNLEVSLWQKLFRSVGGLGQEPKCAFHLPTFSSSIWCSLRIFKPLLLFSLLPFLAAILIFCLVVFISAAQCYSTPPPSPAFWARAKGCLRSTKLNFSLPQGELLLSDEVSHPRGACENIPHKNSLMLNVCDTQEFHALSLKLFPLVFLLAYKVQSIISGSFQRILLGDSYFL